MRRIFECGSQISAKRTGANRRSSTRPGAKALKCVSLYTALPGAKALNVFPFTRRYLEAKPAFLKDLDVYASTLKNWAMLRNFW